MNLQPNLLNQPSSSPGIWLVILAFIVFIAVSLIARVSGILNFAFPIGALGIGIFLYCRAPILYLGFNWWIWVLTPLLTRLVEYQTGSLQTEARTMILAPYLVTLVTAISFFRHLPKLYPKEGLPFFLAFTAMLYSFLIGLLRGYPITEVIRDLLTWIPGIFLGFHLTINWKNYPNYRKNTLRVFFWAALLMGIYGIIQYVVAPEWDRFWLTNAADLQLCCGSPEPFKMRVWSTLNYPFTFAYAISVFLLILFSSQKLISTSLALAAGLTSLLLSQVRGAWVGFLIGLMLLFLSLKSSGQARVSAMIISISSLLLPIALTFSPIFEAGISRVQTLFSLQEDTSASVRQAIYDTNFDRVMIDFVGQGMGGAKVVDAGLLDVFSPFGWIGFILLCYSLFLLLFTLFQYPDARTDSFIKASRAILVSLLLMSSANNALALMPGVLFWSFAGMAIAGHKYYTVSALEN